MAAVATAFNTVTLISAGKDVQQEVSQVRKSFVTGSPSGSARLTSAAKAKPAFRARRKNVVCAAQDVQQQTQNVEGASVQTAVPVSEAAFANISASVSTPPPAPPSSGPSGPAILGAGALVAASIAYAVKVLSSGSGEKATSQAAARVASTSRSVTEAAPAALATMGKYFSNAMVDETFIHACATELQKFGFRRDNCIALVNTCRDEVCRPLVTYIDTEFGLSFNIAGLGGLINCGKTGFGAAFAHSPEFPCDVDGKPRERYVFFAFPHVSVGETGEVGSLLRRGRGKPSSACGALIAIKNDANAGKLVTDDPDDAEYALLKRKIFASHTCQDAGASGLDLVTVTKSALEVITEDLEKLISKTVNPETADYAVITGVQIHSGNQVPGEPFQLDRTIDYVAPGAMYAVIRGQKYDMKVTSSSSLKVAEPVAA